MNKKIYWIILFLLIIFSIFIFIKPENKTVYIPTVPTPTSSQQTLGVVTKSTNCTLNGGLPDKECTPGATDVRVNQENIYSTICVSGYTKTVRPPVTVTNVIKKERMQAYGQTDTPNKYELDHLISLELGGCPSCVANLWPEPYTITLGAREKDKVENYLHGLVCRGAISLSVAQNEIATDWVTIYNQIPQN